MTQSVANFSFFKVFNKLKRKGFLMHKILILQVWNFASMEKSSRKQKKKI